MSLKTKIDETIQNLNENLPIVAANIGLIAMTAAATLGTMPDSGEKRLVLPNQANYIRAVDNTEMNNPIRREKENESAHQIISYGVFQRTPARAGKH
jgi:hypothetical protein